jgi:isopentenyl-diphosphate delta-isomerase
MNDVQPIRVGNLLNMSDLTTREEEIVLLDPQGRAIGTAPKVSSHHANTPYHLAFSSYLVDTGGRVLITRRARDKKTFPGVLTNSCRGHPAPGESLREAVRRRLDTELGVEAGEFSVVLPGFSYRAVAQDGTVEHEQCPVVRVTPASDALAPNPAEVAEARWLDWDECLRLAGSPESSPWFRLQMAQLARLGTPLEWPKAPESGLPPALRW